MAGLYLDEYGTKQQIRLRIHHEVDWQESKRIKVWEALSLFQANGKDGRRMRCDATMICMTSHPARPARKNRLGVWMYFLASFPPRSRSLHIQMIIRHLETIFYPRHYCISPHPRLDKARIRWSSYITSLSFNDPNGATSSNLASKRIIINHHYIRKSPHERYDTGKGHYSSPEASTAGPKSQSC